VLDALFAGADKTPREKSQTEIDARMTVSDREVLEALAEPTLRQALAKRLVRPRTG
jgi:hypothetical protein